MEITTREWLKIIKNNVIIFSPGDKMIRFFIFKLSVDRKV